MTSSEYTEGQVADVGKVSRTLDQYCRLIDERDFDGVAALFTPDCTLKFGRDHPLIIRTSRDYREWLPARLEKFSKTRHQISDVQVRSGQGVILSSCRLHAWHQFAHGAPDGLLWGEYHDRFIRVGNGYLIVERVLRVVVTQNMKL